MSKITKKLLTLVMSMAMVLGLGLTSFAAGGTSVSTVQDAVLNIQATNTGAEVQYQALTVDEVTRYSYYIQLPSATENLNAVGLSVSYQGAKLLVDGVQVSTNGTYTNDAMNFSAGTKVFQVVDSNGKTIREANVTAGIDGKDIAPVTVRLDIKNAIDWVNANLDNEKAENVMMFIAAMQDKGIVNENGAMEPVEITGLKSGATAMDAFKAFLAKEGLVLSPSSTDTYVAGIGVEYEGETYYLSEMATDAWSGWLYLNFVSSTGLYNLANYGASNFILTGGEDFVWCFTNNFADYGYLNDK